MFFLLVFILVFFSDSKMYTVIVCRPTQCFFFSSFIFFFLFLKKEYLSIHSSSYRFVALHTCRFILICAAFTVRCRMPRVRENIFRIRSWWRRSWMKRGKCPPSVLFSRCSWCDSTIDDRYSIFTNYSTNQNVFT